MITSTKTIDNFEVTTMRLRDGQVLNFTVKDPKPESHQHQNSAVLFGAMNVVTGEYNATFSAGDSTKFTPRSNTTPFEPNTVSTLTAVGDTYYVCITELTDKTLNYQSVTYSAGWAPETGCLVVPIAVHSLNGVERPSGQPYVAAQGDTLSMPDGTLIGLFTPV